MTTETQQPEVRRVAIDDIIIADRVREDLGDLESLADSITEISMLNFPVVSPDLQLIAGLRRLTACQQILGWTEIDVHVITGGDDLVDRLRAEQDENLCRKELTDAEQRKGKEALESLYLTLRRAGATQHEAARGAGIPRSTGERWEHGERLRRLRQRDKSPGQEGGGTNDHRSLVPPEMPDKRRKLNRHQEEEVVEAVAKGDTKSEVAKRHGVSRRAVGKTVRRNKPKVDVTDGAGATDGEPEGDQDGQSTTDAPAEARIGHGSLAGAVAHLIAVSHWTRQHGHDADWDLDPIVAAGLRMETDMILDSQSTPPTVLTGGLGGITAGPAAQSGRR